MDYRQAVLLLLVFFCLGVVRFGNSYKYGTHGYWWNNKHSQRTSVWHMRIKSRGFQYIKKYFDAGSFIPHDKTQKYPATQVLRKGIINLQRWGGLEETGEIDEPTVRLITRPRCGVPDMVEYDMMDGSLADKPLRVRRSTANKWNKNDLTYKLNNYPNFDHSILTSRKVDEAIQSAFKIWSDVTPLTFTRVDNAIDADIVLLFAKGQHSSNYLDSPFDGMGGAYAHAFPPDAGFGSLDGDVHFDDDEQFTHKEYFGTNLFDTAAHEIGHALGLNHINVAGTLMNPWPRGFIPGFKLSTEDITAIQALYGSNPNPEPPVTTATAPVMTTPYINAGAVFCNTTFDDVAFIRGDLYVFKDYKYWRFSSNGHLINDISGSSISDFLIGGTSRVSAIFERWYDAKIISVRGNRLYNYQFTVLDEGYPISMSELGMTKGVGAAFHRGSEYISYFFKGQRVYEFNEFTETLIRATPRKAFRVFPGLPARQTVTAAFTNYDGMSYFMVGRKYYMLRSNGSVDPTAKDFAVDFLSCPPRS